MENIKICQKSEEKKIKKTWKKFLSFLNQIILKKNKFCQKKKKKNAILLVLLIEEISLQPKLSS